MHLLSAAGLDQNRIDHWFGLANDISEHPYRWTHALEGKLAGTLFYEPSTRTRWSTEAAMVRLGGQVLSMESAKDSSSDKKGESLADTFKTCSQYVDCLIVRHPKEGAIEEAAPSSDVPVINAGDGANEHPTQALLDLYTILQHFKDPHELTIMFTGDLACSRTIHSLLHLLKPYEMRVIVEGGGLFSNPCGSTWHVYREELYARLPEIDILYMTRHQAERSLLREPSKFIMTNELAHTMKKNAIIMHPLPRNHELPKEVDVNPRAAYFRQVKNGMWMRMALLWDLLHDPDEK
jgi:aspartate carbamoyltransferase catalytic subunit